MATYDAKKSLGQHWLNDRTVLENICQSADIKSTDTVLEIGPGQGSLTTILASSEAQIVGLELDEELTPKLKQKFANQNIKIERGDIRTYDLTKLPTDYKIVANIPYYLTAYLFRLLTTTPNKPSVAVLLVQKEVAERLAAKPGNMSVMAISVQLYYRVKLGEVVPAKLFTPPPKVDSQIIVLQKTQEPLSERLEEIIKLAKLGFSNKRKTLVNNLAAGLHINKTQIEAIINRVQLTSSVRAQELSLDQWDALSRYIDT